MKKAAAPMSVTEVRFILGRWEKKAGRTVFDRDFGGQVSTTHYCSKGTQTMSNDRSKRNDRYALGC